MDEQQLLFLQQLFGQNNFIPPTSGTYTNFLQNQQPVTNTPLTEIINNSTNPFVYNSPFTAPTSPAVNPNLYQNVPESTTVSTMGSIPQRARILSQATPSFENILNTTGNASQYQPTSPNYTGSIAPLNQTQQDNYPDLAGAGALENAQSVGMYSDATTGNLNNVDPNLLNGQQRQNRDAYFLNALGNVFTPMSTETSAFKLGQSLAFNNDNPYASQGQRNLNTLRGIGAGGKTLTSLLRTGFAGAAYQNRQNEFYTDYYNRQSQSDFMPLDTYENGGQIPQEQYLTGSYTSSQVSQGLPNVELEGGEMVQYPSGQVQEVVGQSHAQGGVPMNLEEGTRVISDNLKLGGKYAKEIRNTYDINVKASDTFASAVEKYRKKIGIDKLNKEQEKLFNQLGDNLEKEESETTFLNDRYLAGQIQQTEASKQPLNQNLAAFTDDVFRKQETLKGNDVQIQFENGGTYTTNNLKELFKKHGLSDEKGMEVVATFKKYQDGGIVPNPYSQQQYGYQPLQEGYYGNITAETFPQRIQGIAEFHPEIYNQMFEDGQLKEGYGWGDFQTAVNEKYDTVLTNYAKLYGQDSPQYRQIQQQVEANKFVEGDSARAFDAKPGEFTLSRPTFSIDIIPEEEYKKLQEEGIRTSVDLQTKKPELYKKYVEEKGLKGDFYLGQLPTPTDVDNTQQQSQSNINLPRTAPQGFGDLNLIDQSMPPPSGVQAARMPNAQYRNYEATRVGYEPQLQQLYNQESAAIDQLQGLSPAQRAAAISQISANTQSAANQAISQVNMINQQEQSRIANANTDLFNRYSSLDESERERYEQKIFQTVATADADYRNWLQYNNQLNAVNRQQQLQANTLASLFPNVTMTAEGQIVSNGVSSSLYNPVTNTTIFPQQTQKNKK